MPPVLRTSRSDEDLIEIWLHIAEDNPTAADKTLDRMEDAFERIGRHPQIGAARPDLAPDLRYLATGRYLVLYRETLAGIEIVRVLHGARHLPDLL